MIASSECSHLTMVLNVGVPTRLFLISVHKACLDCSTGLVSSLLHAPRASAALQSHPLWNELPLGYFSGVCVKFMFSVPILTNRGIPARVPQTALPFTPVQGVKAGLIPNVCPAEGQILGLTPFPLDDSPELTENRARERESDAVGHNHHLKWNLTNLAPFGLSSALSHLEFVWCLSAHCGTEEFFCLQSFLSHYFNMFRVCFPSPHCYFERCNNI